MRWARRRGWNDVYTFTKAMGEQMIMRHRGDVPTVIFRPSIIESAFEAPAPGWLDGMRMIDPLIVAYGRRQLVDFPGNPDTILDLVPVDMVVNALLASVPTAHDRPGVAVYQLATGMNNPLTMRVFCKLVQDSFELQALSGRGAPPQALPPITFPSAASFLRRLRYRQILPLRALGAAAWVVSFTSWGRRQRDIFRARRSGAERLAYWARLYSPYTGVLCRYQSDQMWKVLDALDGEERRKFNFDVAGIDWRHYIHDIHIPGVRQFLLGIKPRASVSAAGVNSESKPDTARPQTGTEALEEKKGRPARTASSTGRRHYMITDLPGERELTIWVGTHRLRRPARAMTRWLLALAYRYYLGFQFEGVEQVPTSGPVIVVANHNSHLDTGALLVVLGNRIRDLHPVAAKDYWFRDRVWSWGSRTFINAIPFDRHARLSEGLGLAVALLRQNHSLLYFPEGGRSVTGQMRRFKAGVGVLALESGASIVPANITGSYEALAKGSWLPKRRKIRIRFGTPIPVDQYFQSHGNGATQELARRITDDAQKAVEALC
jgi:1-acyl-sn-glycerol-3-phosphate acyltransferase